MVPYKNRIWKFDAHNVCYEHMFYKYRIYGGWERFEGGVSAGILTQDLPIRNRMLYTAELRRRGV